jgi:hypothetical protein
MHKEDAVQTQAREWPATLETLLATEQAAYTELRDSSLALRKALIQGRTEEIQAEVARHQALLARLHAAQTESGELCRREDLLDAGQEYNLARLAQSDALTEAPALRERVETTVQLASEVAREMAHNRQLIARLSDWMAREIRVLLEPLQPSLGYGAQGVQEPGMPVPALVDRRG